MQNPFNRVSDVDILLFTKHLAVMLRSGISIAEALSILVDQAETAPARNLIITISKDINNGITLHKALSSHPHIFNTLYLSLVHIGEESGNLQRNLEYLAEYLKKQGQFRKKIKAALMYPVIILVAATIVGLVMSIFILPNLVNLFDSLEVNLPLSTRILIGAGNLVRYHTPALLGGIISSAVLFQVLIRLPYVRPYWQFFLLHIPVLGTFMKKAEIATFCRNMGVMLQSGLVISTALQNQLLSSDLITFQNSIKVLFDQVKKGRTLEEILTTKKLTFFPILLVKIVGVGERTGKIDESFLYLAEYYEEEVDEMTQNLAATIEPLILIIIGFFVAFIALSVISPIYEFTANIK